MSKGGSQMATVLKLHGFYAFLPWTANSMQKNILQSLTQWGKVIAGVDSTDFVSLSNTWVPGSFFIARELQAQDSTNQEKSSQMAKSNNNYLGFQHQKSTVKHLY